MRIEMGEKKILITGGTGSVGVTLVETLLRLKPNVVRIFSNDEDGLNRLESRLGQGKVRFLFGDVRNLSRLEHAMEDIDIVFHLASLKHVSTCEHDPLEAVETNVIGTQNVVEASLREEVSKVIFTSSDKAANPQNVLGITKLLAEKLITAANLRCTRCIFSSIRFGNILWSRGSVSDIVRRELEKKEKVMNVTDPDMTRFVLPVSQAVDLILKALGLMAGGEVFVPKISPVSVATLLKSITRYGASRFGFDSDEIKLRMVGARDGDKLYEELFTEHEAKRTLELKNLFIILPSMLELREKLEQRYLNMGARPTKSKSYSSRDVKLLSDVQMCKLLETKDF
jgi:FlaA1/EpsC-like NDP-sugar epimerase